LIHLPKLLSLLTTQQTEIVEVPKTQMYPKILIYTPTWTTLRALSTEKDHSCVLQS
jgi:hypothetical protein